MKRAPAVLSSRWLDLASYRTAFPDGRGKFPMLRYQPYEARWLTIRFDFGLYDEIVKAKEVERQASYQAYRQVTTMCGGVPLSFEQYTHWPRWKSP